MLDFDNDINIEIVYTHGNSEMYVQQGLADL